MMFILFCLFIVIFIMLNNTKIFHPKNRYNYTEYKYAIPTDIWFKKDNNQKVIIFLHGMYSTPKTFEEFGKILNNEGYDIYIPALPASAANLEELKSVGAWTWEESLFVIKDKINKVIPLYKEIILGGHSQGGSFTLDLATKIPNLKGIIVIAAPINLYGDHMPLWKNIAISISGILHFFVPKGIEDKKPFFEERKKVETSCDAEGLTFPLTIYTFHRGLKKLRKNLHKIHCPIFLAYEKGDHLVNFKNLKQITDKISSKIIVKEIFNTPKSEEPYGLRHQLLNYTFTKDKLHQAIIHFLSSLDKPDS